MLYSLLKIVNFLPSHLLLKRSLFIFLIALSSLTAMAQGKKPYRFQLGEEVSVLSNKAFRRSRENVFEAVGNVIVTSKKEALYGESAHFSLNTGEVKVRGNVRYVGPEYTVYGTELRFNTKDQKLWVKNARIISSRQGSGFTVLGREILRTSPEEIVAYDAEYTTCLDCPESWSVFGKKVSITKDEYVRVQNALFKVKGVEVLYLPYVFFPIKRERQSGLLFPKLSYSLNQGTGVRWPFFWAMGDQTDLTLSPLIQGERGGGADLRFRHIFGDHQWTELSSFLLNDQVYNPDDPTSFKKSGVSRFRHVSKGEFHFSSDYAWNHHTRFSFTQDLDVLRDFEDELTERIEGTEFGGESFLEYLGPTWEMGTLAKISRSGLLSDPFARDQESVQVLPHVYFSTLPYILTQSQTPFVEKILFSVAQDFHTFKQNHDVSPTVERNARRWIIRPKLQWNHLTKGPFQWSSQFFYEYADYSFFRTKKLDQVSSSETYFQRKTMSFQTELSFEMSRIFGLAFQEEVPREELEKESRPELLEQTPSQDQRPLFQKTIGKIPRFDQKLANQTLMVKQSALKHTQEYKLIYYRIPSERTQGKASFLDQIQTTTGFFDQRDVLLSQRNTLGSALNRSEIPRENTLELQWRNSIVQKKAKSADLEFSPRTLLDHFQYNEVAFFHVSQGVEFDNPQHTEFSDQLTRLSVESGLRLGRFQLTLNDLYFHDINKHILDLDLSYIKNATAITIGVNYDTQTDPLTKKLNAGLAFSPLEILRLSAQIDYNIENQNYDETRLGLLYRPQNNCWQLELAYIDDEFDQSIGVNFYMNFANKSFDSFNGDST